MSEDLIQQHRLLHRQREGYGSGNRPEHAAVVAALAESVHAHTIVDFGCGKGKMLPMLRSHSHCNVFGYDPAVDMFKYWKIGDFYCAIDTLECLTITDLEFELQRLICTAKYLYVSISCTESFYKLPDGRNCNATIMKSNEWMKLLNKWKLVYNMYYSTEQKLVAFLKA